MRTEYDVYQRLVWSAKFRRKFLGNRESALAEFYPNQVANPLFGERALLPGLEEEAYRRVAAVSKTSSEIFPRSHPLLSAFFGHDFFEHTLELFFDFDAGENRQKALEILEPFDGYVVGPMLLRAAELQTDLNAWWIIQLMKYEWSTWHARRVAEGWPPLYTTPPLADGASLTLATFNIMEVIREIDRLKNAVVDVEVYRWRIRAGKGEYYGAVMPKDGSVFQKPISKDDYNSLLSAVERLKVENRVEHNRTAEIAKVLPTSFLCCSRETPPEDTLVAGLRHLVEPQPH